MADAPLALEPAQTSGGLLEMCHAARSLLEVEMGFSGNPCTSVHMLFSHLGALST
jgi:hypothetical protein